MVGHESGGGRGPSSKGSKGKRGEDDDEGDFDEEEDGEEEDGDFRVGAGAHGPARTVGHPPRVPSKPAARTPASRKPHPKYVEEEEDEGEEAGMMRHRRSRSLGGIEVTTSRPHPPAALHAPPRTSARASALRGDVRKVGGGEDMHAMHQGTPLPPPPPAAAAAAAHFAAHLLQTPPASIARYVQYTHIHLFIIIPPSPLGPL